MNSIPVMELHSSTEINTKTVNTTCPLLRRGTRRTLARVAETALGAEGDDGRRHQPSLQLWQAVH